MSANDHRLRRVPARVCPDAIADRRRITRAKNAARAAAAPRGAYRNRLGRHLRHDPEPDWAAVERAVAGERPEVLTAAERAAAIDRLDACGLSAREVAVRLGMTVRTVQRRRAARRQEQMREEVSA